MSQNGTKGHTSVFQLSSGHWSDLVFIRWYKKTGHRDAVTCDIYEWEQMAGRKKVLDLA